MSEQKMNHTPLRFAVYHSYRQIEEGSNALGQEGGWQTQSEHIAPEQEVDRKTQSEHIAPEQDGSRQIMAENIASKEGGILSAEYTEADSKFRQFEQMLKDAETGNFDYILADSVSSFGRNTKAALAAIERLRELGVGVVFQKENINTLEESGIELLDIISAFAARKSRSHSEAIHRALQENFAAGKPGVNLSRMLGYDLSPDGETWVINEEQAKIVRFIFESFAAGVSANQIARDLNAQGARTVNGNIWRADTVMVVLRNEKYVGDLEMQKTVSSLDGERTKNTGQLPRHYETNHHAAIIERDLWDLVQAMLRGYGRETAGKGKKGAPHARTVFGSLTCAYCGGQFKRYGYTMPITNYTDERSLAAEGITGEDAAYLSEQYVTSYSVWRCENKYRGHEGKHGRLSAEDMAACDTCPESPILYEIALEQSFMEMLYRLKREYQDRAEQASFARDFRAAYKHVYETIGGTGAVVRRIEALEDRIRTLTEQADAARAKMDEALPEFSREDRTDFAGTEMEETWKNAETEPEDTWKNAETEMEETWKNAETEPEETWKNAETELEETWKNAETELEETWKNTETEPEDTWKNAETEMKETWINAETEPEDTEKNMEKDGAEETVSRSAEKIYRKLIEDIERKIAECEEEKKKFSEQLDATLTMKKNYDFFLRCLKALPEENAAGERLNIYGLDCRSSAPDFLTFDKSLYLTFFPHGVVWGDAVEYTTNFGVKVICSGCGRNLNSFIGFRQVNEEGEPVMVTENWQVNPRQIQYRRKERKYRKHSVQEKQTVTSPRTS